MNNDLHLLQTRLADVSAPLIALGEQFSESAALVELKQELADKIARFSSEGQRLSIGIMGQVKAGKSTFLNALLFNGEPVLPEAATPKTANLTRITWGPEPQLVVEYYSPEEWQALVQQAASGEESMAAKVARELTSMASAQQLDVMPILQQGSTTVTAASSDELLGQLNQYVGENGSHTPLVKMTHLYLPREELQGYDVVDTPGMNDPIQSRTQKTRDYMAQCDVVFFLSRASQFLDQSDMDLLSQQLPGKGVKRMILVAGQFDGVLLDDYDRPSLAEAEKNLHTRLVRSAMTKISQLVAEREQRGQVEIATMLRQMSEPVFVSTFAHGFASWPQTRWSRSMQHIYQELVESAEENWDGYIYTQQDWLRIGNFARLEALYQQARADRQPLLEQQRNGIAEHAHTQWQRRTTLLEAALTERIHRLTRHDMQQLTTQLESVSSRIGQFGRLVQAHINDTLAEISRELEALNETLTAQQGEYQQVQTETGSKAVTRSYSISTSKWYRPSTWGSSETMWSTYYESYQYASAADAAEKIRRYAAICEEDIEWRFNQLIDADKLKIRLKQSLIEVMDTGSETYDPAQFRDLMNRCIERFSLPQLHLSTVGMDQAISGHFNGEILGAEIERLRQVLTRTLQQVCQRLQQSVSAGQQQLTQELNAVADNLTQQLTQNLQQELARVQQDFGQRQQQVDRYQQALTFIAQHRSL